MTTGYDSIPHDDFKAGYRIGWEAVNGRSQAPIVTPLPPVVRTFGSTLFLEGVRAGVEHALGVEDLDALRTSE